MECEQCKKITDEKEPYGWCKQEAYSVHDSTSVVFTTYLCGECRRVNANLRSELEKANKGIAKSKEALNEAYSTIAALEQALKGGK